MKYVITFTAEIEAATNDNAIHRATVAAEAIARSGCSGPITLSIEVYPFSKVDVAAALSDEVTPLFRSEVAH